MRRLIIAILLLVTLQSEGQIINASPAYRPTWAVSCSYLLDQYSGAAAAYSLRKLDCDYTGYAIRVRRSSDNSEQDIGFTSNGDLDTTSLLSFVGSNSAYGVTWYSQQGSFNATQSTSTSQPRIVNSGVIERQNGKPSLYFDGGDFFSTTSFTINQPTSCFLVGKNNGTNDLHFFDGNSGNRQLLGVSGGNLVSYAGSVLSFGANSTAFSLYSCVFNGSSSTITRNGSGTVTGNAGTSAIGNPYIGKGQTGGIVGYISTFVIYNSDQTSNRTAIENIINNYYSIY